VTPAPRLGAGLCADCRHAETLASKRSTFLRCRRSDGDPRYARYPLLPVVACPGYERGHESSGDGSGAHGVLRKV
jgi:hypothetical protein